MTSFHESASAALVDKTAGESEVPVIRESFFRDTGLSFDDVESFDEWLSGGDYSRNVLLSLENLTSIDSHRIGWLVTAHNRFCQEGGKLAVHSIRPQAMETVRFLGLDRVLHIAENEAAALRLF